MSRAHHCGLTLLFILIMTCVILMSSQMIEPNSGGMAWGGNTARHAAVRERLVPNPKARLKEQFHEVCRFKHLAVRSEEAYWGWVVRFLRFHKEINLTSPAVHPHLTRVSNTGLPLPSHSYSFIPRKRRRFRPQPHGDGSGISILGRLN